MPKHGLVVLLSFSCLLLRALPPATAAAPPQVAFAASSLQGSGFSPGGQVAWFGAARVVEDYYLTLAHFQGVTAADTSGAASFDLGRTVPPTSAWIAVDLATGAYTLAAPGKGAVRQVDLGPGVLRVGSGGAPDSVVDRRSIVEALLVRPGLGAWELTVADGGAADEDGASDGRLQFSLSQMRPLLPPTGSAGAAPPPPPNLAGQDLLVLLGAERLEATVLRPGAGK